MGTINATTFVTLDDRMVGPNEEQDWITDDFDEEMGKDVDEVHAVDAFILGRVTYEIMAEFWPTATEEVEDPAMIERMNETEKIVFSSTLEDVDWTIV